MAVDKNIPDLVIVEKIIYDDTVLMYIVETFPRKADSKAWNHAIFAFKRSSR